MPLLIQCPAQWMSRITTTECDVTVNDQRGKLADRIWRIPIPSGFPVMPTSVADRILYTIRKGSEIYSLVQAGEGAAAKFAMVPQSSIKYVSRVSGCWT